MGNLILIGKEQEMVADEMNEAAECPRRGKTPAQAHHSRQPGIPLLQTLLLSRERWSGHLIAAR